jgi:hypothetical protein
MVFAAKTLTRHSRSPPRSAYAASSDGGGEAPAHISWLHDTGERLTTACGREIEIWALGHEEDAAVLSAWARHFRQHYISDEDLTAMVDG